MHNLTFLVQNITFIILIVLKDTYMTGDFSKKQFFVLSGTDYSLSLPVMKNYLNIVMVIGKYRLKKIIGNTL